MTTTPLPLAATLALPGWVGPFLAARPALCGSDEERMALVLALGREQVERGSGGPFAAAIFARESGQLLAVGLNRVVPQAASVAHAEVLALLLAQQRLGSFDLAAAGLPACELVSSAQPCAMCYGALLWSGVRRVVCSASREAVEGILGFDEGPLPPDWRGELRRRQIELQEGVLRAEGEALLQRYAELGGVIYNSGE